LTETTEYERTIEAIGITDCVVIAIWGTISNGKDFIALIHKSSPSTVKELLSNYYEQLSGAKLAYMIIPGAEAQDRVIQNTKNECNDLFSQHKKLDTVPLL